MMVMIITFTMLSSTLNAQSIPVFGLGVNAGQGTGQSDGLAIGFDLRFQIGAGKNLAIPITVGFTSIMANDKVSPFSGKTYHVHREQYFPVKIGLKYFFEAAHSKFYGLAETGLAMGTAVLGTGLHLPVMFSPALGYALHNGLDIAVKFEAFRNESYAGIRLGYGF